MKQLLGEYECKIDGKGRMRLPSGLVAQMREGEEESLSFVINRGFENCLMLYPKEVWEKITKEINQLNHYVAENRQFVRYFYRGAHDVEMDSADRVLINKRLMEWAKIGKEVILSAYNDRVEIWAKDQYDQLLADEPSDFSALAENVLGKINREEEG